MDRITLKNIKAYGFTGCLPEEKEKGQYFYITCEISCGDIRGKVTDDLSDTVDYSEVMSLIVSRTKKSRFDLIEHLAYVLAGDVLEYSPLAEEVKIIISKPDAPMEGGFETVTTEITRRRD
mgnify:CR=1 FL=1